MEEKASSGEWLRGKGAKRQRGEEAKRQICIFTSSLFYFFAFLPFSLFTFLPIYSIRGQDFDPELNLWPFVYYDKNKATGLKELDVLYPFFTWQWGPESNEIFFRPLYNRKELPREGIVRTEFLWPLGFSVQEGQRSYTQFYPFYFFTKETDGERAEHNRTLFPFFFSKNTESASGGNKDLAIFPFYGKFHNRFGKDSISFILWPLYTRVAEGGRETFNFLWPIFAYTRVGHTGQSPGSGFGYKVWPIYGHLEKKGKYEKGFIFWPLYTYTNANVKGVGTYSGWASAPFYVTEHTPFSDSQSVLWPLFSYVNNRRDRSKKWTYPWPIAVKISSEKRQKNMFLPMWNYDRTETSETRSIVYPLNWWRTDRDERYVVSTRRFVPVYWSRSESWYNEGKKAKLLQGWPLFKHSKEKDGSLEFETLSLYPLLDDTSWNRNWGPFFGLYHLDKGADGVSNSSSFFWKFARFEKRPGIYFAEVKPFFSYYKGDDDRTVCLSMLFNLIKYKQQDTISSAKLLYLFHVPLGKTKKTAP
ncbi:MAG: hypothetical protein HY354_04930 [Planctomycetes bacterium]|nr:hypothetical protein [Planctomycetota bacterium]